MVKRKTDDAVILKMHEEGKSLREIAAVFSCSKTAVRKQLLRLQKKAGNPNPQDTEKIEDKPRVETLETFTPKYIRKIGTRELFAYSPHLMKRGDMLPYTGPIPIPEEFDIPQHELEWLNFVKGGFQ